MTIDFDQLNWLAGCLDGQFHIDDITGFEEIAVRYRQWYGLEELDPGAFMDVLKARFHDSYWRVLIVPDCFDNPLNATLNSQSFFLKLFRDYPSVMPFYCPLDGMVLETNRLYPPFEALLYHLSELPLLYVFNARHRYFIPVDSRESVLDLFARLNTGENPRGFQQHSANPLAYFLQLSDLHLGRKDKVFTMDLLLKILDEKVPTLQSNYPLKIFITGDIMDSPSRKNMYLAGNYLNELKRRYHAEVQFVLGNHDMVTKGINVLPWQKAKVVAYLLAENVHLLPDVGVLLIKLNSSLSGNFARGMIGPRQLEELDDELSTIPDLSHYTPFVLVHHHLAPVQKADFLKKSWQEGNIVGKVVEKSKALIDSEEVLEWLEGHHIHYVLHGHEHIPALTKIADVYLMGAGSSTGLMKDGVGAFLSYNLIQYDVKKKKVIACTLYYEDGKGQSPKHIYTRRFEEE